MTTNHIFMTTIPFCSHLLETNKQISENIKYNIQDSTKIFLNDTPNGGEYSPQRIPQSNNISAVRLDDTGLQRFLIIPPRLGQFFS